MSHPRDAGAEARVREHVGAAQPDHALRSPDVTVPGTAHARADTDARGDLTADVARRCATILASEGPMAMLAHLNGRTRFRFTGLYRAEPPNLLNLYLYDRENPTLDVSGELSRLEETFCSIVCDEDRPFATADAQQDDRVTTHLARERVLSYCGVPIRRETGRVWGTLCHFDVRPRLLTRTETAVLEHVATMLGTDSLLTQR